MQLLDLGEASAFATAVADRARGLKVGEGREISHEIAHHARGESLEKAGVNTALGGFLGALEAMPCSLPSTLTIQP